PTWSPNATGPLRSEARGCQRIPGAPVPNRRPVADCGCRRPVLSLRAAAIMCEAIAGRCQRTLPVQKVWGRPVCRRTATVAYRQPVTFQVLQSFLHLILFQFHRSGQLAHGDSGAPLIELPGDSVVLLRYRNRGLLGRLPRLLRRRRLRRRSWWSRLIIADVLPPG